MAAVPLLESAHDEVAEVVEEWGVWGVVGLV